jgi:hypothetical protein
MYPNCRNGRTSAGNSQTQIHTENIPLNDQSETIISERGEQLLLNETEFLSKYFNESENKWMHFLSELDRESVCNKEVTVTS